jgi:hypothetical protein
LAKKYWLDSGVLACSLLLNDWLIVIADVVKKTHYLVFSVLIYLNSSFAIVFLLFSIFLQ